MQEIQLDKHVKLLDSPGIVMDSGNSDASIILRNCIKVRSDFKTSTSSAATLNLGVAVKALELVPLDLLQMQLRYADHRQSHLELHVNGSWLVTFVE